MSDDEERKRDMFVLGLFLLAVLALSIQTCDHEMRLDNVEYWRETRER